MVPTLRHVLVIGVDGMASPATTWPAALAGLYPSMRVAAVSGVPAETLRKIETGRIATPAFFTVAALAGALGLALEDLVRQCAAGSAAEAEARAG